MGGGVKDNPLLFINSLIYEWIYIDIYIFYILLNQRRPSRPFREDLIFLEIFTKQELEKLFFDVENGKDIFEYERKIVKYLFEKVLGIEDFNHNILMYKFFEDGYVFLDNNELKYSWDEESFKNRFGISRKEYRNVVKVKHILTKDNYFQIIRKEEDSSYIMYLILVCLEKLRRKYLI